MTELDTAHPCWWRCVGHTLANNAYRSQGSKEHKRKAAACLVPAPRVQIARIVCGGRVPPAARDGDHPPVLERLHRLGPQLVAAQQIRPSHSCKSRHDLLKAELQEPATQVASRRADVSATYHVQITDFEVSRRRKGGGRGRQVRTCMGEHWTAHQVSPWPSWPYLHQPKVYTTPSESATMLCRHPQATDTTFTSSMLATC